MRKASGRACWCAAISCGTSRTTAPPFLALANQLGLADWLDFRGRIDDEGELMATLSACDVFLLSYADGVSLRRGSFQAVSQLAVPLVTTTPEQVDEFDAMPALKAKIQTRSTALCTVDAAPEVFAEALGRVAARKGGVGVKLSAVWGRSRRAPSHVLRRVAGRETVCSPPGIAPAE